jgi:Domain of unknown function (DUF4234)
MTGRMGKTRNAFLVWLVWPLITFGIYRIVWWYKINREARDLDERIIVSPGLAVLAITLGAFIIVPPFVSVYRTGERIGQMQAAAGLASSCNGVLGLISSFIFGLDALYYPSELNKIWAHLGDGAEGTQVTLPGPASPAAGWPGQGPVTAT